MDRLYSDTIGSGAGGLGELGVQRSGALADADHLACSDGEELGLDHRLGQATAADERLSNEFHPVLEDGDFVLCESVAIMEEAEQT